jgi:hypothetical protein
MSNGFRRQRPVGLVVLDGWGYRPEREGNAIELGHTPVWHGLWAGQPRTLLDASGLAVGPLYYVLLTCLALAVVAAIRVVGLILVEALLVIPAAIGYQLTRDYRAMLEREKVDLLIIATWPHQHEGHVLAAVEAGVPAILCEKSMTTTGTSTVNIHHTKTFLLDKKGHRKPSSIPFHTLFHGGE